MYYKYFLIDLIILKNVIIILIYKYTNVSKYLQLKIMIKNLVNNLFKKILNNFDYKMFNIKSELTPRLNGVNLNVGCGNYTIKGLISLDYYSKAYYCSKKFIHIQYDMRNDLMPYDDNSVDNIYCSHVIEHIEAKYVKKFLFECVRILKKGGVLRIACPDTEYLYHQLIHHPEFFSWHKDYEGLISNARKCFVELVAEPKYKLENFGLSKKFEDYQYTDLVEELRNGLSFDEEKPGSHINSWDFTRISKFAKEAKFSCVEKSRFQSSIKQVFRARDMDLTQPLIALYVELIK